MKTKSLQSGVGLVGGVVILALFAFLICGLIYVGRKVVHAGQVVVNQREHDMTNELTEGSFELQGDTGSFLFEDPEAVWTPITNELWLLSIPDAKLTQALTEVRTYGILFAVDLEGPWLDTGNRVTGNPAALRSLLFGLCNEEGPHTAIQTKAGPPAERGFYKFVPAEEIPIPGH